MPVANLSEWIYQRLDLSSKLYVEPFGSQLGIIPLIASDAEVVATNDIDGNLASWWPMLVFNDLELTEALRLCKYQSNIYKTASDHLKKGSQDLGSFNTAILQSVLRFREIYGSKTTSTLIAERVCALKAIYRKINVVHRSPLKLLRDCEEQSGVTVFCDWAYYDTCKERLRDFCEPPSEDFKDTVTEIIMNHNGQIAIAGYKDSWNHLSGWHKGSTQQHSHVVGHRDRKALENTSRMFLWTNYEPEHGKSLLQR